MTRETKLQIGKGFLWAVSLVIFAKVTYMGSFSLGLPWAIINLTAPFALGWVYGSDHTAKLFRNG